MPITRRQFIKRGAGAVSVSLVLPKLWQSEARAQNSPAADPARRIFVVIQMAGGNDGLNTVIPYTDSRYQSLRPNIGLSATDVQNTILNDGGQPSKLALHPSMTALKSLYDAGRVGIILGVGYPTPNLSHFTSQDIWQTANPNGGTGSEGWLGKYADAALVGQNSLSALSVGASLPKTFFSDKVVIPDVSTFASYDYTTDNRFPKDDANQMAAFNANYNRTFDDGTFLNNLNGTGRDAVDGAATLQAAVANYSSTVTYPNTGLAGGLKMLAEVITTIPEANLLYVTMGGFDSHSAQVDPTNKTTGDQANLLQELSEGISAFYQDMTAHGLADNVLMMTWSEFGRRVNDNSSRGTDHGTAGPQFVIGNPVKGGKLYGIQPSLAATDLDSSGNMKFQVDFRATYGTILDKWLHLDSASILGAKFEDVGFLG